MNKAAAPCNAATAKTLFPGTRSQVAGCSPSAVLMLFLKIGHLYKPNMQLQRNNLIWRAFSQVAAVPPVHASPWVRSSSVAVGTSGPGPLLTREARAAWAMCALRVKPFSGLHFCCFV